MAVQTVWIYIHIHSEAEGATIISEHLKEYVCSSPPCPRSLANGKDKFGAGASEGKDSITNHNIITPCCAAGN